MTPEKQNELPPTGDPALASASGSDASNRKPAEVFSVGQHLQDEMDARGWSLEDLLNRMPGDRNLNQLWIEMVLAAHEFDDDLHLLAVAAVTPGIGQFRRFLQECEEFYQFIRLWCVMDDAPRVMLLKYGFQRGHDTDRFGQMQEVWDWRKIDGAAP